MRIHVLMLIAAVALLSACNVALSPGYTVEKQQVDVQWTSSGELVVRGSYRLKNTGNQPLDFVEVTLPTEPRRSVLQVWLDQSPASTEPADEFAPEGTLRIPLRPAWPVKKKLSLVVEYRLERAAVESGANASFYFETHGWYPVLREQAGLFGGGGDPPEKWDLRVTVPRDFLVHASGKPKGKKRRNQMTEHRFRQRTGRDFDPFIVAGRYIEQRAPSSGGEVILWTYQPIPETTAQAILGRVGQTSHLYRIAFGEITDESPTVRIAEVLTGALAPLDLRPDEAKNAQDSMPVLPGFPGGLLVETEELRSDGEELDSTLRRLDEQLTLSWFHFGVTASSDSGLLFNAGLPPYAATIAAESRGNTTARGELVSSCLELYRGMGGETEEPRFFLNEQAVSLKRIGFARGKAPLFFLALEDHYGEEVTRRALARLVDSLRGRQFNTNDLRVAIQLETGEDPQEFFRQWLNQPGIPEEFRKKYEGPGQGAKNQGRGARD